MDLPWRFNKLCWEIVKKDMMTTLEDFDKEAFLDIGSNTTFISFIPRKGADLIKDFRPISIVGSMYKIISKVLACHVNEIMNDIISPNQSAFIEGC